MATALAADSYTFDHGRAAFHGTSAVDQAEPHLDVFELCALSTDILKASVPQSGTPRCPDDDSSTSVVRRLAAVRDTWVQWVVATLRVRGVDGDSFVLSDRLASVGSLRVACRRRVSGTLWEPI